MLRRTYSRPNCCHSVTMKKFKHGQSIGQLVTVPTTSPSGDFTKPPSGGFFFDYSKRSTSSGRMSTRQRV